MKGVESRNAPSPKAFIGKTPDLRPHLNIRNPKQQPPGDPNAAHQVWKTSKHAIGQPELRETSLNPKRVCYTL